MAEISTPKKLTEELWVTIETDRDEQKFRVRLDYPTTQQIALIRQYIELANSEDIKERVGARQLLMEEIFRFCVKDWQNVTNNGKQVPCVLRGNMLSTESFEAFTHFNDTLFMGTLYEIFNVYWKHLNVTQEVKKN